MLSLLLAAIVAPYAYAGILVDRNATQEDCDPAHHVSTGWFAGWHARTGFPVSDIKWESYTHMAYAFATTTPDVTKLGLTEEDPEILKEFVTAAKTHGVTTSISVGGWTGSQHFSTAVATAKNRTAFVQTLSNFVKEYKLDGIDFDWEYPNKQGVGCNAISPNDTANFLLLLKELRRNPHTSKLILSAAVSITPFVGSDGKPSADVKPFAKVLDWIQIMNYDIWGSWSTSVGPNAPLDDSCAAPANQQGSATGAVKAWTDAGIPSDQILLGVPAYGHSFSVNASVAVVNGSLAAYPAFNSGQPKGDAWDIPGAVVCGVQQTIGGTYTFSGLVATGFLTSNGQPAPGIFYRYDNCSQTAYVYNETSQIMVSYDNVRSFAAKGAFIGEMELGGSAVYEVGGDPDGELVGALLGGAWQS